jgi:hypothetical protein
MSGWWLKTRAMRSRRNLRRGMGKRGCGGEYEGDEAAARGAAAFFLWCAGLVGPGGDD